MLDFGLASRLPAVDADTLTGTPTGDLNQSPLAGTLLYLAPERLRGSAADARSDVWALGVLVYEMAAGRLPFRGANPFELTAAILETSPAPLPDRIPVPLRTVIGRCLERDRARRFQHAGEVPVALETLQLGSRPSPVAWTERLPAPLSRFVARLISKDPAERYGVAAETAAALDLLIDDHKGVPARVRVVRPWPLLVLTIIFLTIGAYVIGRFQRQTLLQLSEQRLISTVASSHRAPSYSPDGKMMAYVAPDATGAQQIWVRDLEQGTSVQVTNGKANASRPRWLPASNLVLFALAGQGIWTVSPIGGTPSQLLDRGTNPNVSRDGSHIVFEHKRTIGLPLPMDRTCVKSRGRNDCYMPVCRWHRPYRRMERRSRIFTPSLARMATSGLFRPLAERPGGSRRICARVDGLFGHLMALTIIVSSARAGSRTLWQIPAQGGEPSP